jgi:hypothetical protein
MPTRILTGLAAALLLMGAGCASEPSHQLRGRVLDAETGEPVSRQNMYVHFFCDEIDFQQSLDPEDEPTYSVRLPQPKVRIRAADGSAAYALFEQTLTIEGEALEYDIRLTPTHFVLLRGRAIDAVTGKAIRASGGMGGGPLLYFDAEQVGWSKGMIGLDDEGAFSLRVPRAKLTVRAVNTPKRIAKPVIDLTGYEADEREVEIRFEQGSRQD